MAQIEESLKARCREQPDRTKQVVITLTQEAKEVDPAEIGIPEAQQIQGLAGVLTASIPGRRILELEDRAEIEQITEDMDVQAL